MTVPLKTIIFTVLTMSGSPQTHSRSQGFSDAVAPRGEGICQVTARQPQNRQRNKHPLGLEPSGGMERRAGQWRGTQRGRRSPSVHSGPQGQAVPAPHPTRSPSSRHCRLGTLGPSPCHRVKSPPSPPPPSCSKGLVFPPKDPLGFPDVPSSGIRVP